MTKYSRREFLKLSAAAASAAALAELVPLYKKKPKKILRLEQLRKTSSNITVKKTMCYICGQKCPLKVYVDGYRIEKIVHNTIPGYDDYFATCGRPQTLFEMRFVPERIRKPLIRVGKRGEGKFREITWEEALALLVKKLKEYRPDEIIVFAHKGTEAGLFKEFMKSIVGTPNVTEHCDTCHTGLDISSWFVFGKLMGPGAFRPDYEHAKLVVFMGRNPVEGIVATPWTKSFSVGKEDGLEIIVFDVRETRLTSLAHRYYIIPPGTDLAIGLAIIHVILRDKLYNSEYLVKYTNAPMLIYTDTIEPVGLRDHPSWKGKKDYLVYDEGTGKITWKTTATEPALMWEGEYNGRPVKTVLSLLWDQVKQYTPQWAEGITGVPASEIEYVAKRLANQAPRAFIDTGYKAARYYNEAMFFRVKHIINALIGAIGAKGGIAWPYKPKIPSPFKILGIKGHGPQGEPLYKYWLDQGVVKLVQPKCFSHLALKSLLEGKPKKYKMVIIFNENVVAHSQGSSKAIEALKNAEFVVVIDVAHNETTPWADLVLPITMPFEQDSITLYTPSKVDIGEIGILEKVIDPPPGIDAKPGWWIIAEIGKRIDPANASKYEALENPRSIWIKQAQLLGINPKELLDKGIVILRSKPIYHPLKGKYLPSVTGEIELISVKALQEFKDYIGKSSLMNPLPVWIPPRWMMTKQKLSANEFIAVDTMDQMTAANMWIRFSRLVVSSLNWRKFDGVLIHKDRARKLGIKDGDLVRIQGPGGEIIAKARLTSTVHPLVILGAHATNPGRRIKLTIESINGGTYEVKLFSWGGGYGTNTNMLASFDTVSLEEGGRANQCDVVVSVEKLKT